MRQALVQRVIAVILLSAASQFSYAQSTPEATLDKYFEILTTQDYNGIASLMDSNSMTSLKETIDGAIRYQANHGVYRLQRRIFGKKISLGEVSKTPAEYYLAALAEQIVSAAREQHLIVTDRTVLGRIDEGDDMTHIVARLTMKQDETVGSDVLVYSLIKENGEWKLKFPETIKQMITVIDSTAKQIR